MVVKIRLARFGRRHATYYNIVVTNARTARNSKPFEVLGTYNPYPQAPLDGEGLAQKTIQLDTARARYWIGVGAQPSDAAWDLLHKAGLLPMQLHKRRAIWRSQRMDEMHAAVSRGELSVEQLLERSGGAALDAEFAREIAREREAEREQRARHAENSLELDIDDAGYLPEDASLGRSRQTTGSGQDGGFGTMTTKTAKQMLKRMQTQVYTRGDAVHELPKRWDLSGRGDVRVG